MTLNRAVAVTLRISRIAVDLRANYVKLIEAVLTSVCEKM